MIKVEIKFRLNRRRVDVVEIKDEKKFLLRKNIKKQYRRTSLYAVFLSANLRICD
jgi:hypothetical protein